MHQRNVPRRVLECSLAVALLAGIAIPAAAQPILSAVDLSELVSRIALYPDPLLAQLLSAATYSDQIPDAAKWADEHHYLTGDALAAAISGDHLPWDPSVQALLPFPSVLEMMAGDMAWTQKLGSAVLAQKGDVMDAVQRMRHKAKDFGYLKTNTTVVVGTGPYLTILPVRNDFYCVPVYDPAIVFVAPRPGFVIATAINFGFGVSLGGAFRPWWGGIHFGWEAHSWYIGDHPWGRTWANRATYVHAGYTLPRYETARRVETHELIQRSEKEREASRLGHARPPEEHHRK